MANRHPWPSAYRKSVRSPDIQHQFPLTGFISFNPAAVEAGSRCQANVLAVIMHRELTSDGRNYPHGCTDEDLPRQRRIGHVRLTSDGQKSNDCDCKDGEVSGLRMDQSSVIAAANGTDVSHLN